MPRADWRQSCQERGRLGPPPPRPPSSSSPFLHLPLTLGALLELHPGVPPAEAGASVGLAEGRPSGGWVRSSDWLVCLGPAEGDPCLPDPVEKPHRLEPRGWCFSAEMASLTQARPRPALGRDPVGTGRESPWGPALRLPLASPCPHTHPVHSALLLSSWCELAFQWEKHFTEYRENKVEIIIGGKSKR